MQWASLSPVYWGQCIASLGPNSSQKQLNGGGCVWAHVPGAVSPPCWGGDSWVRGSENRNPGLCTSSGLGVRKGIRNRARLYPQGPPQGPAANSLQGSMTSQHSTIFGDRVFKPTRPWRTLRSTIAPSRIPHSPGSFYPILILILLFLVDSVCIVCVFPPSYSQPDFTFTIVSSGQPKAGACS